MILQTLLHQDLGRFLRKKTLNLGGKKARVEGSAHEREKLLSSTLDAICHGISVLDSDFNILLANKTFETWRSGGLPIIGRKCYEAYHGQCECCEHCPAKSLLPQKYR
jgi:hypothetical protein